MDRYLLFSNFLDNLELYLSYKETYTKKMKALAADGNYDIDNVLFEEKDTLEHLRELTRRALDEYVSSVPAQS